MLHEKCLGMFCVAIGASLWSSTSAVGEDSYAVVYTAKVPVSPAASIEDLENIARKLGSKEVFVFPAGSSPCTPTRRVLERFGDPAFAYPGFSVRPHVLLDEQTKLGKVSSADSGKLRTSVLDFLGVRLNVTWQLPQDAQSPLYSARPAMRLLLVGRLGF